MRDRYKGKYPASKADEKALKQRIEIKKLEEQLQKSYKDLFAGFGNGDDAKRVLDDLMKFCMVGRTTMTGNSWTYFNEGKRAVGEHIRTYLDEGV